jgi:hypothetical protein
MPDTAVQRVKESHPQPSSKPRALPQAASYDLMLVNGRDTPAPGSLWS